VQPETAAVLESVAERLSAAGAPVVPVELPDAFADLGDAQAVIQGFEAARNLGAELREHRSLLTPRLLEMLDAGARVPLETYETARQAADACRAALSSAMGDCHVLIAASATGEAPGGLESTGSPIMNRTWTLLHAPSVNIPGVTGPNGLPVGVQVIGRVSDDATTLAAATWVEERLRT
jgi:Asp-tRNA(Asn)/Glu-tRNA(Gln) amidotransferase A subunit family amidase